MGELAAYGGLFLAALLAATILPAQSEAALAALLLAEAYSPVLLITVASIGNVLGSVINWLLGRGIDRFRDRPWFPVRAASLDRASSWYQRYGRWTLLLSWLPIIGDPLTVAAGVLREPLWSFLLLVAVAKIGRYLVLATALGSTWW
ncbi:membrane protein [Mesorhizobium sp. L-8-10]|uniref:YqaA family protein n=1 Tax=unclassified Mesorhizobium TaxID=325217 RepID=UPI0019286888|nr:MULTISPECIES: YqaA family protein [unclassified Mesorhizobium]BCH23991.1 membrane protein [Mesorhizobium sp. L-8-3]BCH31731.1 membrane protein [Mesorhizobium sp. L-8-10]